MTCIAAYRLLLSIVWSLNNTHNISLLTYLDESGRCDITCTRYQLTSHLETDGNSSKHESILHIPHLAQSDASESVGRLLASLSFQSGSVDQYQDRNWTLGGFVGYLMRFGMSRKWNENKRWIADICDASQLIVWFELAENDLVACQLALLEWRRVKL